MSMPVLEVDVGNSSAKWRLIDQGARRDGGRISASGERLAELVNEWQVGLVRIVSVAGPDVDGQLAQAVIEAGARCEFVHTQPSCRGLVNSYAEPGRMGADRWVAMLAAWHMVAGPFIVVDAGTALTIDVVDGQGRHRGGYILPGRKLMLSALGANTERVRYEGAVVPAVAPGASTAECVEHGVWLAMLAAVREVYAAQCAALGCPPKVLLTGGDAPALLDIAAEPHWVYREELVLDGLAVALAGEGSA